MGYLEPGGYAAYGLDVDTADALVTVASSLMEAHCRRPTLLAAQYTERVRLIAGSRTVRLSYGPLYAGALVSGRVRYAKARRGDESGFAGDCNSTFLQQISTAFGLPGTWSALDVATVDVYAGTRELTLAADLLGIGYNEVELTYTAGFAVVPAVISAACAQIVRNAQAIPALNVKKSRLDTMQVEYFSGDLLDDGVRAMLRPYVAERLS